MFPCFTPVWGLYMLWLCELQKAIQFICISSFTPTVAVARNCCFDILFFHLFKLSLFLRSNCLCIQVILSLPCKLSFGLHHLSLQLLNVRHYVCQTFVMFICRFWATHSDCTVPEHLPATDESGEIKTITIVSWKPNTVTKKIL